MDSPAPTRAAAWVPVVLALLVIAAVVAAAAGVRTASVPAAASPGTPGPGASTVTVTATVTATTPGASNEPGSSSAPGTPGAPAGPRAGGDRVPRGPVFAPGRVLVAYYGTAETGALGVLGETDPDEMQRRVARAARPFARAGGSTALVYELIVTIADRSAGPDGDYSHDIARAQVERYLHAAHRHGARLLLDLQPGRSGFLEVARRWAWALRDPSVGLALDPEWRMGPREVPATVIGHVRAAEVNRTSAWLSRLVRRHDLPQKLFVVHQFRTSMLPDIGRVVRRPGLAMVQHVDGFGTPQEKLATYHAVAHPQTFRMGLKLFYDEDRPRMTPARVLGVRPRVRFVSFQ